MLSNFPPVPQRRPEGDYSLEALVNQQRLRETEATQAQAEAAKLREQRRLRELETEAAQREEATSPYEQARQIALFGLPMALGTGFGAYEGHSINRGKTAELGDLAKSVREGDVSRGDASMAARRRGLGSRSGPLAGGLTLAALGVGQRAVAPELTDNPIGQDVIRAMGGLEAGVGTGLALQQLFRPPGEAKDIATVLGTETGQAQPPQTPPAASQAPETPRRAATHSDKLKAAVRDAGGPTVRTKAEAQAWLDKNVTDANRGAVGRALGVKPGPNFTQRLTRTIKDMASRPGMALLAPLGAAAVSYDAARSGAEAGDGEMSPATGVPEAAIAGGATAGGVYGMDRAIDWGQRHFPKAMRAGGRLAGPLGFGLLGYDAYRAFQDADIDPGQKQPTTSDIRRGYRQQMGYE